MTHQVSGDAQTLLPDAQLPVFVSFLQWPFFLSILLGDNMW